MRSEPVARRSHSPLPSKWLDFLALSRRRNVMFGFVRPIDGPAIIGRAISSGTSRASWPSPSLKLSSSWMVPWSSGLPRSIRRPSSKLPSRHS